MNNLLATLCQKIIYIYETAFNHYILKLWQHSILNLHFLGNTEVAFNFYKSVLGGDFIKMVRYKDLPISEDHKIPEAYLDKIMHIGLPLGKHNILIGSDTMLERNGQKFTFGDNFHIAISAANKEEVNHLFKGLSADGK